MHAHRCWTCNHIWEHADSCFGDEKAHTCEKCGKTTFSRYDGPIPISTYMASELITLDNTGGLATGVDVVAIGGEYVVFFEKGSFYKRPRQ